MFIPVGTPATIYHLENTRRNKFSRKAARFWVRHLHSIMVL
jgi:hypothetical protein